MGINLNDILDYENVIITDMNGKEYFGKPIAICYEDESGSGENELDIETDDHIISFLESEIKNARGVV